MAAHRVALPPLDGRVVGPERVFLEERRHAAELLIEKPPHVKGHLFVHVRRSLAMSGQFVKIGLASTPKVIYTCHTVEANQGRPIMPRNTRFHVDELPETGMAPKHLTKQQFGRRLYQMMLSRGWNQSELARQADLPRDSISTYVRGIALPTPKSLQSLATALGVAPADLLPNAIEAAIDDDHPSFSVQVSPSAPSVAWLRVNRLVTMSAAMKIGEILENDTVAAAKEKSE